MESERPTEPANVGVRFGRFMVPDVLVWIVVMVALVGLPALSMWLLHEWFQRRFDLPVGVDLYAGAAPGGLLGLLLFLAALWTRPSLDPEQRRRAVEAAEPGRRRHRVWLIVFLCLLLLQQLVILVAGSLSRSPGTQDWGSIILVFTMVVCSLGDFLPSSAGASSDLAEPDQAERCEALRVGYLVLVVLGVVAAAASVRWPLVAAQAWPSVLLASLLAALIRLATLPRRPARPPDHAP